MKTLSMVWRIATLAGGLALSAGAQVRDTSKVGRDTTKVPRDTAAANLVRDDLSDISPGNGVLVAATDIGVLRISAYGLARYINQLPGAQTYVDHLNVTRDVDPRQDIQWHRVMVHFLGWMYLEKLNYVMTVWTVNSTEQVRVVGSLTYALDSMFNIGAGINGLPGTRSLNGSHPFWLAPDRVMADEYFRPGFTGGVFINGRLPKRLNYAAMLGNNISQLGVSSSELTRDLATAASIWWLPTTGEFGPRGGYGDYSWHERLAVRLGTSYTRSREDRAAQLSQPSPDNTQIRISDGLLLFQTGALANGVTVRQANYRMSAADLGFKYRGWFLQGEMYHRWLNTFDADGPLPLSSLYDRGYYVAAAAFPVKKKLELYTATSQIYGSFNRSWEVLGGANLYPANTQYFRVNLHIIRAHRSPVGSVFGYYAAGLHGWVISTASYLFF
jgi:hypothetical protein